MTALGREPVPAYARATEHQERKQEYKASVTTDGN